jgi:hypothetical protein
MKRTLISFLCFENYPRLPYGRVRLRSWTPEILPIQAPARARICRCMAFGTPAPSRPATDFVMARLLATPVFVFTSESSPEHKVLPMQNFGVRLAGLVA